MIVLVNSSAEALFGYPREKGFQMAMEVHTTGRVILLTTTKEHAELKQEQIHAFGPDPLSSKECAGSMTVCQVEPVFGSSSVSRS